MNYRNILFLIFFLVTFILVPALIIWPSVQNIRTTAQSIYSEYEQLEAKHRRGHEMKYVAADYNKLLPESEKLKIVAVGYGDELRFITGIEKLATDAEVEQTLQLKVDEIKKVGQYQQLPFDISITGTYQNTLKYINSLESQPAITQISDIRMSSSQSKGTPNEVVQTRISAYVLQEQPK